MSSPVALDNGGFALVSRVGSPTGPVSYHVRVYDGDGVAAAPELILPGAFLPFQLQATPGGFMLIGVQQFNHVAWTFSNEGRLLQDKFELTPVDARSSQLVGFTDTALLNDGRLALVYQDLPRTAEFTRAGEVTYNFQTGAGLSALFLTTQTLIEGTGASDTLAGTDGSDRLLGYEAADVIEGGRGDDVLIGGPGADRLDGGDGTDTVSFQGAGGIQLSLAQTEVNSGDAEADSYVSIERFVGSAFADLMIGDGEANHFDGGAGDDDLRGGGGPDQPGGQVGGDLRRGQGPLELVRRDDHAHAASS